jgi:hypothetical protein
VTGDGGALLAATGTALEDHDEHEDHEGSEPIAAAMVLSHLRGLGDLRGLRDKT